MNEHDIITLTAALLLAGDFAHGETGSASGAVSMAIMLRAEAREQLQEKYRNEARADGPDPRD